MPIYLPPLSRRRFLAHSFVAAAGLVLGPRLFAASRKTAPDTWALLSDIHIPADPAQKNGDSNMADNLASIVKDILASSKGPQAMVATGDLAFQRGEVGDYDTLRELLKPLREVGMPIHLVLGNHDHRERVWKAFYERSKHRLANKHVDIVRTRYANWFMLDSMIETLHTPGMLGAAQREWLARELDANSKKPAILAFHHQPTITRAADIGLQDTAELLQILRPRQQVKACFFGHTHGYEHVQHESGIHLVNLPATAYTFDPKNPCGWVLATHKKNGMHLEFRCIDVTHQKHKQAIDISWRTVS